MGLLNLLFGAFGNAIINKESSTGKVENKPQSKVYTMVNVQCPVCGKVTRHKYISETMLRCYDCGNEREE